MRKLNQIISIIKASGARFSLPETEAEAIQLVDNVCEGECGNLDPASDGFEDRWLDAIDYFSRYFESYANYSNECAKDYRSMYE